MALAIAVVLGAALLAFCLYLALLLRLIRQRGFGEGRSVDLPGAGISLRLPDWWTLEAGHLHGPGLGDETGFGLGISPGTIRFRTGNQRGLVTIRPLEDGRTPEEPRCEGGALGGALEAILARIGLVLDEAEIKTGRLDLRSEVTARSGEGRNCPPSPRHHAWVASNGRPAAVSEERSYFEVHLVVAGGRLALLTYSNSVLFGYLDAFYIQRILNTIQPLEEPARR